MKTPSICQICLRTDKELKVVDRKLFEFHDELCDFLLNSSNPLYCMECAHLLRKLYNFQLRCQKAINILENWKKTQASERKPAHLLYTLLPQSTLGFWTPDNSTVYSITHDNPVPVMMSRTKILMQEQVSSIHEESSENTSLKEDVKMEKVCETLNSVDIDPLEETLIDIGYFNSAEEDRLKINENDIKKEENITTDLNDIIKDDDIKSLLNIMASISNDHCYIKNTDERVLANVSLSDNEFDNNEIVKREYEMEQSSVSDDDETKKTIDKVEGKRRTENGTDAENGNQHKRKKIMVHWKKIVLI